MVQEQQRTFFALHVRNLESFINGMCFIGDYCNRRQDDKKKKN